jgi:hypothetical protein
MKRLVLLGEGHGEVSALPVLARKLLCERDRGSLFFVDDDILRTGEAAGLIKWDKQKNRADCREWIRKVGVAARRSNLGGILALFDGDARTFPAGSPSAFCAAAAAKFMAVAAGEAGAGKIFSLAVVFACVEYETWIIAGAESLAGKSFKDGRPALPRGLKFPAGELESHGKRWLEEHCPGYRPTRDQSPLTELLDVNVVRAKKLRSFSRLEHAIDQLLEATGQGSFISTPA